MKFIADLHIHSHFSRATSKKLIPEYLEYWAKIKGINVVGTGDCAHPGWLKELVEKLEPAENGLYKLKKEFVLPETKALGKVADNSVYFMPTGEISSIYKKNDKVRKVHNVVVLPDFASVYKLQEILGKIGNITSDGRPILGLNAKILLEKVLGTTNKAYMIPAHIWTPWFSVLGSKSGFNTLEECFEELTSEIFAVETGLSSDPPMNRACSILDKFRLVSNSDCHSPEKLGREANLFDTDLSYQGIYNALKFDQGFLGTIEFFPQEGKYHYDGHRKCKVCFNPLETLQHKGKCPICQKPLTLGVMYRVAQLADKKAEEITYGKQKFYSITPLPEIISEMCQVKSTSSTKVEEKYFKYIRQFGSEFEILLFADLEKIKNSKETVLAEGIKRMREGKILIEEGYDGEFGKIKVFGDREVQAIAKADLFTTKANFYIIEKEEQEDILGQIVEGKTEVKKAIKAI